MRPVKDRGTWPARTLRRPLDPQRRDVARAGVAHANTGPAARGCRPRTDGLRGSIRRRDRSSRGSGNGDRVRNHHPRSGQPQTPDRASKGDEPLAYPDTCHHCAYPKARDRGQTQAHPAPFAASPDAKVRQVRGPAKREGCFWAPACEHPRTAAARVRTAPATTRRGSTATKFYCSRSPCPNALRLIIAATATTAPQPPQRSVSMTPGSSACFATPWASA